MNMPVFWKLLLGNAGILGLSAIASLYSIVQLNNLSANARTVLGGDHRMIGYQESLTDAFLSEVRYGGKYIITHAEDRYEQLRYFKTDFERYMDELKTGARSEQAAVMLSRIDQLHRQYHRLYDQEVKYIRAKQNYSQSRYQQERDKILESALSELHGLKSLLQKNLHDKLQAMDRAARNARQIALAMTFVALLLGAWLSLRISKSINDSAPNTAADRAIRAKMYFRRRTFRMRDFPETFMSLGRRFLRRGKAIEQ